MLNDILVYVLRRLFLWTDHLKGEKFISPPSTQRTEILDAATRLIFNANSYSDAEAAFSLASIGRIGLDVENGILTPDVSDADFRYEAYCRLHAYPKSPEPTSETFKEYWATSELVRRQVVVADGRWTVPLSPKIVNEAKRFVSGLDPGQFELPPDWMLGGFSLGEFREVAFAIQAIAFLRRSASLFAARANADHRSLADLIYLTSKAALIRRIRRYAGVPEAVVTDLVEYITFGSGDLGPGARDPALQPLVPLGSALAVAPFLFLGSNLERNVITLANKIPKDRATYQNLSNEKERLMVGAMKSAMKGLSFWSGSLPGRPDLPDVDLAIIDPARRIAIVTEMKWFLPPAEPREIREKTAELRKGVEQVKFLRANEGLVKRTLGLGETGHLHFALVSKNWIGHWEAQDPQVPIVQMNHLIDRINSAGDVEAVGGWLKERRYLPAEGADFVIHWRNRDLFGDRLRWYGLQLLGGSRDC